MLGVIDLKHILLLGAGHAHVAFLKKLETEELDCSITCLSPSSFQYYSGMFSGFTEGLYEEEEIRINVEALCSRTGVSFLKGEAVKIDPCLKQVETRAGKIIQFDILSVDIGSLTKFSSLSAHGVISLKPTYTVPESIQELRSAENPVIIGGGAAGVELALSAASFRRKYGLPSNLILLSKTSLMDSYGDKLSKKMSRILIKNGIGVIEHQEISNIEEHAIYTDDLHVNYDIALAVTGPKAHPLLIESGMECDEHGFLLVNAKLQVPRFPFIFGAGDCVTLKQHSALPKNGVYAIRQAPVLFKNIRRFLSEDEMTAFNPQKRFISILSAGDKKGLFLYGGFSFYGSLAWRIKHWIDRRYMRKMGS
ncbi:pyridine nucleotide-disulfide oxidoreductase [Bacillus idriensis]|uniref:Pyridine nucleotide-disulfide oxidoreductase n=1 Tax=Metabacillus idriensis TaxID=324768 RepID=A0A6I2M5C5_9BACI|nr:pyridine nucleotide-disulfide oxidoreductase [Metabacillus idriensis]